MDALPPRPSRRNNSDVRADLIGTSLEWKPDGDGWRLFSGRRRFGRVIPDAKYPGMWRSPLPGGRLSDMANFAWACNAVLEVAIRELEWEAREAATAPPKCPENEGVFSATASPMRQNGSGLPEVADESICIDCGVDTCPSERGRRSAGRWEHYMVRAAVWRAAGMKPNGGYLCIGCLEERLGRRLQPKDFTVANINDPDPSASQRLLSRLKGAS